MKSPSLLLRLSSFGVAAFMIGAASAVTVSIGPESGPGTSTSHVYQNDYGLWFIADLEADPLMPAPILISTAAASGAWTQTLNFAVGAPNLSTGDVFIVQQLLEVSGGGFSVNNWKQEVLTPGWQWSEATIYNNDTSEVLAGLSATPGSQVFDFTFNNLAPGQEFLAVQVLEYVGPDDAAPAPITIRASVVPEPASASLLMLGSTALLLRSRRRRN